MKKQSSKIFFSLFFSFSLLSHSYGQSKIGVIGGISQTWNLESSSSGLIPGFSLGIKARIPLAEHIHFQPELLLVNQKSKTTSTFNSFGQSSVSSITSEVTMIQVPLWIQLGQHNHFGFGLSYGFPFSSGSSGTTTVTTQSPAKTTSETFSSKSKNFSQMSIAISYGNAINEIGWEVRPSLIFVRESGIYGNIDDGFSPLFNLSLILSWNKQ